MFPFPLKDQVNSLNDIEQSPNFKKKTINSHKDIWHIFEFKVYKRKSSKIYSMFTHKYIDKMEMIGC